LRSIKPAPTEMATEKNDQRRTQPATTYSLALLTKHIVDVSNHALTFSVTDILHFFSAEAGDNSAEHTKTIFCQKGYAYKFVMF
jgi:hypothetical protein